MIAIAALACGAPARGEAQSAGAEDQRLAGIGYRLATANAGRCARPEMLTGLTLHDAGAYDAEARPRVARAHGLTSGFGVLRLLPGSSGERAGLREGDEIVGLNGSDLGGFAAELVSRRASAERTERFTDRLGETLRDGPATLAVRRGGERLTLTLEGEKGCGGRFVAVPGGEINAWADGRYVAVTASMLRFAADDRELAFVVAHEMAHNILGHTAAHAAVRGKAAEAEADAFAMELLAAAGQDLTAPTRFLKRSASLRRWSLNSSHPGNRQRIRTVDASIARMAAWSAAAAPAGAGCLVPAGVTNDPVAPCGARADSSPAREAGRPDEASEGGAVSLAGMARPDEIAGEAATGADART